MCAPEEKNASTSTDEQSPDFSATSSSSLIPVFGYGSNNLEQVGQRVQATDLQLRAAKAILPRYQRKFVCHSNRWGGGIATVVENRSQTAGTSRTYCRGSVIWLSREELERLDKWEDVVSEDPKNSTRMYRREELEVEIIIGESVAAPPAPPTSGSSHCSSSQGVGDAGKSKSLCGSVPLERVKTVAAQVYVKNVDTPENLPSPAYLTACVRNLAYFWSEKEIADELQGLEKIALAEFSQDCIRA
ncbi:unnamed protein product [Amoebophrya sp. A120]|nr:unnamed protein product [Amoebophrya sp. A120]|eukprot:GSA120T00012532001.1